MKKVILISIILFFVPFFLQAEEISNFDQVIDIHKDGSITVTETISYDFGDLERHGIFREIPFKYTEREGVFKLRFSDIDVMDHKGERREFVLSDQGSNKHIKIGDPDKKVSGKQVYVITYTVDRAINYFDDFSELYWNVSGHEWPVIIRQTKSVINLPEAVNENNLKMDCFSGYYGETNSCVSSRFIYEGADMVKSISFVDDVMQPGKGVTVVLGMPMDLLERPGLIARMIDVVKDNYILLLPFFVFIYMYRLWYREGRDPEGRGVVVAQFDAPDKLSPMGAGTVLDMRADNRDFSANILSLAVKGYLKIIKIEKGSIFKTSDYALLREDGKGELRKSEQDILEAVFKSKYLETSDEKLFEINYQNIGGKDVVLLSKLKNKFYTELAKIKKDIKLELTESGYFDARGKKNAVKYMIGGIVMLVLAIILGSVSQNINILYIGSLLASAVLVIVFSALLVKRTIKGVLAKEHILGLKRYLEVAEKDRLKFHNAPDKNPETFERLLPYAIALGVEDEWAKQFEGIYKDQNPSWYSGSGMQNFGAASLVSDITSFSKTAQASTASTSSSASSGGSGFSGGGSGGGFGGGGGGSW